MTKTGLIIALDGMPDNKAFEMAKRLGGMGLLFKANDLLYHPIGSRQVINTLKESGEVMADPKIHDIPKTMGNTTRRFSAYGPKLLTVHGSATVEGIREAVEKRGDSDILVVTVLTSISEEECNNIFGAPIKAKVLQFARNAVLGGAQGIVCSGLELGFLKGFPELDPLIRVAAGIRPSWHIDSKDDQKRIITPAMGVKLGARYLVVGRPVTDAEDPVEAAKKTLAEIEEAEAEMAA